MSYGTRDDYCSRGVICSGEYIEADTPSKKYETQDKQNHWSCYRGATKSGMLEKISKYLFVPLSDRVDDTNTQWDMSISDTLLPFSFEDQKFFFFICRAFYSMRVIDIVFSLADEEEIESTIYRECEDESCSKYSEYRDRYVGEEFSENPWKCHHRDKYDDRRHHS